MTWIVKARTGYRYCCHRDGTVFGPDQSDALRFKTRAAAERAARKGSKCGPKEDPLYVVELLRRCPIQRGECQRHGFVHGAEAEALRKGIEAIIAEHCGDAGDHETAKEAMCDDLQKLLDDVDARDSLAFLEGTSQPSSHAEEGKKR